MGKPVSNKTHREVSLVIHITSGIEFEVIDIATGESLTNGRTYWASDEEVEEDDSCEEEGWEYFRHKIKNLGWLIVEECFS